MEPVGLLIGHTHISGGALDIDLCIHQAGEVPISITGQSCQEVKEAAGDMAVRARTLAAMGKRKDNKDLKEINTKATAGSKGNIDQRSTTYLNSVRNGRAWDAATMMHAGHIATTICELYGDLKQTIKHSIWVCTAFCNDRIDIDKDIAQLDSAVLPIPIRIAIAPAMSPHGNATYWGADADELPTGQAELLGVKATSHLAWNTQTILDKINPIQSARQFIAKLRHTVGTKNANHLSKSGHTSRMPETTQTFSLTADYCTEHVHSGVWWPAEGRKQQPMTEAEDTIMHIEQTPEGTSMWTAMHGYVNSSTRMAIGGAVVAMMPPYPGMPWYGQHECARQD